jgi:GT2 family glycosyltransferase
MKKTLVSIILVNYGDISDTCECLESLTKITYEHTQIIIVDNGSLIDRSEEFKKIYPCCIVVTKSNNGGFASGVNAGVKRAEGEYIMLLNNDTVVTPGFIEPLIKPFSKNSNIGLISPQIRYYYNKDRIQYAGATAIHPIFSRGRKIGHGQLMDSSYDIDTPTQLCNGACMMIHRHVFEDVGYLSEKYFMYYEEHDFTQRAKSIGWKCYYVGSSLIFHKQSGSIGSSSPLKTYYLLRNRYLYQRTFQKGTVLFLSGIYLFLIIYPIALLRKTFRNDLPGVKSVVAAVRWHIKNYKRQVT